MTSPITAVVVALALQIMVMTGLVQHVRGIRAVRRELDRYLRWLIDEAAGPISV